MLPCEDRTFLRIRSQASRFRRLPERAGKTIVPLNSKRRSVLKKVFVQSFGCRASQADGAAIQASLEERGFVAAADSGSADLVVLNTCTVTHGADVDAHARVA